MDWQKNQQICFPFRLVPFTLSHSLTRQKPDDFPRAVDSRPRPTRQVPQNLQAEETISLFSSDEEQMFDDTKIGGGGGEGEPVDDDVPMEAEMTFSPKIFSSVLAPKDHPSEAMNYCYWSTHERTNTRLTDGLKGRFKKEWNWKRNKNSLRNFHSMLFI